MTVRAGTPIAEVEAELARRNQYLAFEPPRYPDTERPGQRGGTIGGMVATGLSGPSRAAMGSVRDYVLGMTLLTGKAEVLTFGGQVMKKRRRLRRGAHGGGLAGHPGRDLRGVAEGDADAVLHQHAALRLLGGRSARPDAALGRPAAAGQRDRVVAGARWWCACPGRPRRWRRPTRRWAASRSTTRWRSASGWACATRRMISSWRPAVHWRTVRRCGGCRCRRARRRCRCRATSSSTGAGRSAGG